MSSRHTVVTNQIAPYCGALMLLAACSFLGCDRSSKPGLETAPKQAESSTESSSTSSTTTTSGSRDSSIQFVDVTQSSGVQFVHFYDGGGKMYIVEPIASGMASLDFDLDGLQDLYFLSGGKIPPGPDGADANALYRNVGTMRFEDVSQNSLDGPPGFSTGVVSGDFNHDGFPDLFVNNFGRNQLLQNNGDGTFTDVTDVAGVAGGNELGAGTCFLDADGDGFLDLYVGNYVKSPVIENVQRTTEGFPSYPGPLDFKGEVDRYYRNLGNGQFEDQSDASGISRLATTSMGIISTDYDSDGDPDVIVVNDVDRNLLLENDGTGVFEDVGITRGIAYSFDAQRNGNMGIDCADFNLDGSLDLFTTTFSNDLPVLYKQDGHGSFNDVTQAVGAGTNLVPHANWGTAFLDVDHDGYKDLFVANGHTDPNVNKWAFNTSWKVPNSLFRNRDGRRFQDISQSSGTGLAVNESSRGAVVEDFDNDGDLDLVVLNALAPPTIMENRSQTQNWLKITLVGTKSSRDGTGARVKLTVGDRVLVDEVHSGRGYQSSYGLTLHFGLGDQVKVDAIEVSWPNNQASILEDLAANQHLVIVQD